MKYFSKKRKSKIFILWVGIIIFSLQLQSVSGSLVPIIEGEVSTSEIVVGQSFTITWIIIDDNPSEYTIYRDDEILLLGPVESTTIQLTRLETVGNHTFVLEVFDYSGNVQNNSLLIEVSFPIIETTISTISISNETNMAAASSGFLFTFVLFSFGVMMTYRKYKR